ncbi:MAG: VRR-NUC domain-containing protein [Bifidobacteriaceae bacterium]|nr:VRR-NUC domain-containing protein [Bifidobacteriaceae bacterium]
MRQVRAAGGLCWKFSSPATSGVPDRVVVLNGRTVFVETKAAGRKLAKLQRVRLEQIVKAGGEALVLDSRSSVDVFVEKLCADARTGGMSGGKPSE